MSLLPGVVLGNLIIFQTIANSPCSRLDLQSSRRAVRLLAAPLRRILLLSFPCCMLQALKFLLPMNKLNCFPGIVHVLQEPLSDLVFQKLIAENSTKHRVYHMSDHNSVFFAPSSKIPFLLLSIFLLSFPLL